MPARSKSLSSLAIASSLLAIIVAVCRVSDGFRLYSVMNFLASKYSSNPRDRTSIYGSTALSISSMVSVGDTLYFFSEIYSLVEY